ncbi:MAG: carbamoyltransferase HypF [Candidatus Thermoplasmatota archaeon]
MYKIFIEGVVQGVGFRPYIYRKAHYHHLVGSVRNTGNGVEIIINDKHFMKKLTDLPPLATITNYTITKISSKKRYTTFSILKSSASSGETSLPPDIYLCDDCKHELHDKNNRRYQYYFITCTNCGPRFSMIDDYPYDRPNTAMHTFPMCHECRQEYTDPLNRRYHAQTIACKNCGPKLKLIHKRTTATNDLSEPSDIKTIRKAVTLLKSGEILAIKGIGGFHTCSLCIPEAVYKIRTLFHRPHKPYAILVKDLHMAHQIAQLSPLEQQLLQSPQRPIVVVAKKNRALYQEISELDSIGIMLPYTALHYLLFDHLNEPLVMTSCNMPGEPITTTETIGSYFLTHERPIINRCDDSVLKVVNNHVFYLRRSRGYTPLPIPLPLSCHDTVALGAELNNVICTAKKHRAFLSQYIGDTSKYKTYQFLQNAVNKMIRLTRLNPKIITCDLHPAYSTTHYATDLAKKYHTPLIQIQHHKAHIASVAAEYNLTDYVGIAMDGLGYGDDGKLWGGEVFLVQNHINFTRIGHLEEQPQLGGDTATIYPKKMLFGILSKILSEKELRKLHLFPQKETNLYIQLLNNSYNIPFTTSTGRILDAAAACLGLCDIKTYDGRPAMLLESTGTTPVPLRPMYVQTDQTMVLKTTPLFEFLLNDTTNDTGKKAATIQHYLAEGIYKIASKTAYKKNLPIVFSGGVAYNRMIASYMICHGVLINKNIPCGDGGTCYGQAYLANRIYEHENQN